MTNFIVIRRLKIESNWIYSYQRGIGPELTYNDLKPSPLEYIRILVASAHMQNSGDSCGAVISFNFIHFDVPKEVWANMAQYRNLTPFTAAATVLDINEMALN